MDKQVLWENNLEIQNFKFFPFWNLVAKVIKTCFPALFVQKLVRRFLNFDDLEVDDLEASVYSLGCSLKTKMS